MHDREARRLGRRERAQRLEVAGLRAAAQREFGGDPGAARRDDCLLEAAAWTDRLTEPVQTQRCGIAAREIRWIGRQGKGVVDHGGLDAILVAVRRGD